MSNQAGRYIVVLSGDDENSLWAFYNKQRDMCKSYKFYELSTPDELVWAMDEIHSDDIVGQIDTCFLYLPYPTSNDVQIVMNNAHNRLVDWNVFIYDERDYFDGSVDEVVYPAGCSLWMFSEKDRFKNA